MAAPPDRDAPGRPRVEATGEASGVVHLSGPLDVAAALAPLARHGDDLIDRWDGAVLRRTTRLPDGSSVAWAARLAGDLDAPRLEVVVAEAAHRDRALADAARSVSATTPAVRPLAQREPVLGALVSRHPALGRLLTPDLLTALVRAVSAQQVNLRWAATTRARLAHSVGTRHVVAGGEVWSLDAGRLAATDPADLRALQFTTAKAVTLVGCGAAVAGGLDSAHLEPLDDEAVIARLVALRGIGRWTAEWVLARTLDRPVVVAGDLGVRKVVGQAFLGVAIASEEEVRRLTAGWGAAGGAAQALLLHAAAAGDDLPALGAAARGITLSAGPLPPTDPPAPPAARRLRPARGR